MDIFYIRKGSTDLLPGELMLEALNKLKELYEQERIKRQHLDALRQSAQKELQAASGKGAIELAFIEAERSWLNAELAYAEQNMRTVKAYMALLAEYRVQQSRGEAVAGALDPVRSHFT